MVAVLKLEILQPCHIEVTNILTGQNFFGFVNIFLALVNNINLDLMYAYSLEDVGEQLFGDSADASSTVEDSLGLIEGVLLNVGKEQLLGTLNVDGA